MQFIAFITIKTFLLCSLIVKKNPKHKESKNKTDHSYDKCRIQTEEVVQVDVHYK